MNDEINQTLYNELMRQGSSRISDSFRPQLIHLDMQDMPFKENSDSESQFPDICSQKKNFRQKNVSLSNNPIQNSAGKELTSLKIVNLQNNAGDKIKSVRNSGIIKMMLINHQVKQFVATLKKKAYIYPQNKDKQIKDSLQENYFKRKNWRKSKQLVQDEDMKKNVARKLPVFNPSSKFMLIWEFFRAIQLAVLLWWLPFKISFKPSQTQELDTFETFLTYIFIPDLAVKFNKGIFDQGKLITKRTQILKFYMINELYEDLIYFITLIFVISDTGIKVGGFQEIIVLVQFMLNFTKLKKYLNKYEETFIESSVLTEIVNLIKLIIITFYFAHFMACVWYYVGIKSASINEQSWTQEVPFQEKETIEMYVYSFYWATTTMVTVGYGDISGKNVYEVLCAIVLMIFSSGIFAFSMNSIGSIFTNMDAQKQVYRRTLLLVNQYMNNNQVQEQLQGRIRNYLKYHFHKQDQLQKNEIASIIEKLPSNLKQELISDVQFRVMQGIPFFNKNFSEEILPQIACDLILQSYTPREIIYSQNSLDECCIYIVWKGEVNLIDEDSGKVLKKFTKGECFGELEFLTAERRHGTAISCDFSQLYHIPRSQFLKIINSYFSDFQQFHKLKDSILFEYGETPLSCYCCQEAHSVWRCPYTHYQPDLERVVKKNLFYDAQQERCQFTRKGLRLNVFRQESVFQSSKRIKSINEIDGSAGANDGIQLVSVITNNKQIPVKKSIEKIMSSSSNSQSSSSEENESPPENSIKQKKRNEPTVFNFANYHGGGGAESRRRSVRQRQHASSPLYAESPLRKPVEMLKYGQQKQRRSVFFDPAMINILQGARHSSYHRQSSYNGQQLSGYENDTTNEPFFDVEGMDKMIVYTNYFPQNNYDKVIESFLKYLKKYRLTNKQLVPSKYVFVNLQKVEKPKPKSRNAINYKSRKQIT